MTGADRPELAGVEWRLVRIDDEEVVVGDDAGTRMPYLTFDGDGRVAGSSGVNRVMSGYELDGDELRMPALAGTRMAGSPAAMALEQRFLDALGTGGAVRLDGDELTIGEVTFRRGAAFDDVDGDERPTSGEE
jgi:heat shock protein HslJ